MQVLTARKNARWILLAVAAVVVALAVGLATVGTGSSLPEGTPGFDWPAYP